VQSRQYLAHNCAVWVIHSDTVAVSWRAFYSRGRLGLMILRAYIGCWGDIGWTAIATAILNRGPVFGILVIGVLPCGCSVVDTGRRGNR
jgi:hypothetical protein